ncbi:hypothetical protein COY90_01640 [Candidatus Roizmanbacteria bacterium CG_4_10_14_0_8_um_filter_39_9]|uniref:O-antigen ligase-related domain-containing protein n=1 Tax=Candidatus Roizmanbacteria bacterium CG_4_10_14_0_8_um_filter_39_9 TaxID=1974829 RepID=A0A2M7QEG9_9BACT|nr:MAG: hypothetical protein COY90_01640 [Candidatus Roizmanbacteria bacterium CG_4_10_14_0_8_um_filter_39_9]
MSKCIHPLFSFLIFLALVFFSSVISTVNAMRSTLQLLLWTMYGCIFTVSLILPIKFKYQRNVLFFVFMVASFLYIGHSANTSAFSFLSDSSYQFILPSHGSHNHLGDLAGLFFSSLISFTSQYIFTGLLMGFTLTIMAISFSKSAFLGVLVVLALVTFQKKGKYFLLSFLIVIFSLCIIGLYTQELSKIPLIHAGQQIMQKKLHLAPKPILSVRDYYFPQVIRAWQTAPLEQLFFGFGSGNYIYPSIKTGSTTELTPTETHNIFLSILAENGPLSLLWFAVFCILILFYGLKAHNKSFYLFIFLLVNFQTDFTYSIPFFMGMFFFFAGQSVHNEKITNSTEFRFLSLSLVCMIVLTLFAGYSYFSIQNNKHLLDAQLKIALKNKDGVRSQQIISRLELITPYEERELVSWSFQQEMLQNLPDAIRLLEKLSVYSPRWYLLYLPHQFELQKKSNIDLKKYIIRRKNDFSQFPFSKEEKNQLNFVCNEYAKMSCI